MYTILVLAAVVGADLSVVPRSFTVTYTGTCPEKVPACNQVENIAVDIGDEPLSEANLPAIGQLIDTCGAGFEYDCGMVVQAQINISDPDKCANGGIGYSFSPEMIKGGWIVQSVSNADAAFPGCGTAVYYSTVQSDICTNPTKAQKIDPITTDGQAIQIGQPAAGVFVQGCTSTALPVITITKSITPALETTTGAVSTTAGNSPASTTAANAGSSPTGSPAVSEEPSTGVSGAAGQLTSAAFATALAYIAAKI